VPARLKINRATPSKQGMYAVVIHDSAFADGEAFVSEAHRTVRSFEPEAVTGRESAAKEVHFNQFGPGVILQNQPVQGGVGGANGHFEAQRAKGAAPLEGHLA
jgi:hypothetical protein